MALGTRMSSTSAAAMLVSNVIPAVRKVLAESWADELEVLDRYDPRDVHVSRVTGEFNTVVQISAAYCLRSYATHVGGVRVIARKRGSRLTSDLAELREKITDVWWNTQTLDPSRQYGIGLTLTPVKLAFSENNLATVTFSGTIELMTEAIIVDPVPETRPQFPRIPAPGPVSSMESAIRPDPSVGDMFVGARTLRTMSSDSMPSPLIDRKAVGIFSAAGMALGTSDFERPMRMLHQIGNVEVTVTAAYESTEHAPQRSVDVWMNMNEAKVVVTTEAGDATLFYEAFLETMADSLAAQVAPVGQVPLAPTVSLAGRNAANVRINEFTQFDTRTFHVAEGKRQAICVAFDVVPGCKGIIEEVRHFIGGLDYGVIHDEYVIERVAHHKWNAGGFDRSLGLSKTVSLKVRRDGRDSTEDGTVSGRLILDTLDVVALVPHADLRTDVLSLGGQAQAVPDKVVLRDGTVLTPNNADLGPTQDTNWAVDVAPAVSAPWQPDPELRDFQTQAHRDCIRHLARPFSRFPINSGFPQVQYTRTEAVQKRMFFLGILPTVFH